MTDTSVQILQMQSSGIFFVYLLLSGNIHPNPGPGSLSTPDDFFNLDLVLVLFI